MSLRGRGADLAVVIENEVVIVKMPHGAGPFRRSPLRISCHPQIDTDQVCETSVLPSIPAQTAETARLREA
jgi:hypothetical protein